MDDSLNLRSGPQQELATSQPQIWPQNGIGYPFDGHTLSSTAPSLGYTTEDLHGPALTRLDGFQATAPGSDIETYKEPPFVNGLLHLSLIIKCPQGHS